MTIRANAKIPDEKPDTEANASVEQSGSSDDQAGALARSTYKELRRDGMSDTDIMAFAGELLSLVATDVRATAAE